MPVIKMELNQDEIELAIKNHLKELGFIASSDIAFTSPETAEGLVVGLEASIAVEAVLAPKRTRKKKAETKLDAPKRPVAAVQLEQELAKPAHAK